MQVCANKENLENPQKLKVFLVVMPFLKAIYEQSRERFKILILSLYAYIFGIFNALIDSSPFNSVYHFTL